MGHFHSVLIQKYNEQPVARNYAVDFSFLIEKKKQTNIHEEKKKESNGIG